MITRRSLFKIAGVSGFLLSLGKKNALASFLSRPKRKKPPKIAQNRFTKDDKVLVGVAGGTDPKAMISETVTLIGGFEKLGVKDKKVLVKPNVVSRKPHPSTTNPEVVKALVTLLYEEGARQVFVGDMSALWTLPTLRNMRKNMIKKAAEEAGAQVVAFEDHDWIEVDLPRARFIKKAYVTEWLYKVDLIVNLPVIKTHRSASYSICLKNFIGCTHLKQRPYLVDSSHWEELVAEFNLAFRSHLNIVDGTVSMIEGGPWEGTPADTNLVIASGDPVAADIIGLGIIKSFGRWKKVTDKDVWEQRQIKRSLELGLGSGKDRINLVMGRGDERYLELMLKVKTHTGL